MEVQLELSHLTPTDIAYISSGRLDSQPISYILGLIFTPDHIYLFCNVPPFHMRILPQTNNPQALISCRLSSFEILPKMCFPSPACLHTVDTIEQLIMKTDSVALQV